jgi:hypothetical protein
MKCRPFLLLLFLALPMLATGPTAQAHSSYALQITFETIAFKYLKGSFKNLEVRPGLTVHLHYR